MLNKAVLIGRLTRDPELRYTASGTAVTRFTLAVQRSYANEQGEREADFIPIVVWRGAAESCAKYLSKGRLVAVSGRIHTGSYEAEDGTKRYKTEVVAEEVRFLDWGHKDENGQDEIQGFQAVEMDESELPF